MNLPNKLTVIRIAMIPVFVTLFLLPFQYCKFAALGVFALASLTDMLDGQIARKHNLVTDLGKFLDPIADKMLVISALIAVCTDRIFFEYESAAFSMVVIVSTVIIVCRELAVSAFRIIAADKGVKLAADRLGKIKTILQMVSMLLLIPLADIAALQDAAELVFLYAGLAVLVLATLMTLVSGVNYIAKNRAVLKENEIAAVKPGETSADAADAEMDDPK